MDIRVLRKWAIELIIIFFAVLAVESACNFSIIRLQSEKKGVHKIEQKNISAHGFEKSIDGYQLDSSNGELMIYWDGSYINKLEYGYQTSEFVNATITVGTINAFGKEETVVITDNNPILLSESIVNIKSKVNWIKVSLQKSEKNQSILIQSIIVDNSLKINKCRILVTVLIILGSIILFDCREIVSRRIEYGFCIVAFISGIIMLIALPTNKVGWDEETHFRWAYEISLWPEQEMVSSQNAGLMEVTAYNWPDNQPDSYEEKKNLENELDKFYKEGDHAVLVNGNLNKWKICGLIFHATGIKVARLFGMSFHNIYMAGRLLALIIYIIVMTLAIHIIPVGKKILTFIGLMPTSIFLAICYTYDTVIMSFISLGLAILLREWLDKSIIKVNIINLVIADICLFFGIWCKAIYAPLVLLGLLIPKDKFENKKQIRLFKIIVVATFMLLMATFVLPQIMNPSGQSDSRISGADSGEQMKVIFNHMFTYTILVLKKISETFGNFTLGAGAYRAMGHLGESGFIYLIPILAVVIIITEKQEKGIETITGRQRIVIGSILMITIAMIWTALYLSYNNVGTTQVGGVQGRYYHPLLMPLYIICTGDYIKVKINKYRFNGFIIFICAVIICSTSIKTFMTFCG